MKYLTPASAISFIIYCIDLLLANNAGQFRTVPHGISGERLCAHATTTSDNQKRTAAHNEREAEDEFRFHDLVAVE